MDSSAETIFVIDDDRSVRRSLSIFLISHDFSVEAFSSSEEYLERETFNGIGCILLDVNLEGKSGLELQEELLTRGSYIPIIFITGRGNIKMSVETLKKGAVNFLEKPFNDDELLLSIKEALDRCKEYKAENNEIASARELVSRLTPRETDILKYIMNGMLNKQIAFVLGIAEHTVKLHRHSICEKLGVKSVPEILEIANKAGLKPSEKIL